MATETDADAAAARLAALRAQPDVVVHRPKARKPFKPVLRVESPIDLRVLLGRDDDEHRIGADPTEE